MIARPFDQRHRQQTNAAIFSLMAVNSADAAEKILMRERALDSDQ